MTTEKILLTLTIVAIINILFILALAIIGRTKYKNKRKLFNIYSTVLTIQGLIFLLATIIQFIPFTNIGYLLILSLNPANILDIIATISIPAFAGLFIIVGHTVRNSSLAE